MTGKVEVSGIFDTNKECESLNIFIKTHFMA